MHLTHLTTLFLMLSTSFLFGQLSDDRVELFTDVAFTQIAHSSFFADVNEDGCMDMFIFSDNYEGVIYCSGDQVYAPTDYTAHPVGRGVAYTDAFIEGIALLYSSKGFFQWNGQGFDQRSVFVFDENDVQCQLHDLDNSAGPDIMVFDENLTDLNVHYHLSQTGHTTRTTGTHLSAYSFLNTGFIDNNSRRDIITVNRRMGASDIRLYINQGFKSFDEVVIDAPTDFQDYYAAIIDIDDDNDGDLIISGASTYALRNNNGSFGNPERILPRINIISAKTGDINQDGHTDLFILSQTLNMPYEVGYALNNGDGTLSYTMLDAVASPLSLFLQRQQELDSWTRLVDIDGDGDLDGIVNSIEEDKVLLYRNQMMTSVEDESGCKDQVVFSSDLSDQFSIRLADCANRDEMKVDVQIMDIYGRPFRSLKKLKLSRSNTVMSISPFPTGTYIVVVTDQDSGISEVFDFIKTTR